MSSQPSSMRLFIVFVNHFNILTLGIFVLFGQIYMLMACQGPEGVRNDVQIPTKSSIQNLLDVQVLFHEKSMRYLKSAEFSSLAPKLESLNHGKVGQQGMIRMIGPCAGDFDRPGGLGVIVGERSAKRPGEA
ncbi:MULTISPECIES: hypothetical protein [unclassified Rhodanobacter]|uniref:hypothetical protein n=1 Tax=unclassified Rhodanobacter TaxID=2621553 RepID=UPI000A6CDDDD|nr:MULTISPECIES: hypothetical protein [unclassified Rhodanobacter]